MDGTLDSAWAVSFLISFLSVSLDPLPINDEASRI